ncbi:chlorophyllase-1-like [Magnolia sinica]|uniref:chlorophyllase-1-like n=1 Tax=Magnolia sinica TaxID=86752 RepID=UPI00265B2109|nr:chlorophyllase-1-like [Magnolia sinica]
MSKVFEVGKLSVTVVEAPESSSPPKPLLISTPTEAGEYPVVVFFHGFCLTNSCYSAILQHVASHGYIAVAPQLYSFTDDLISNLFSANEEIESAFAVLNWLSQGLQSSLPNNVQANLPKLAIAGHSRGGRAAFYIALHNGQTSVKFSLLMGIDPVAGGSKENQLKPPILTYKPSSFDIGGIPVLVVGSGLGEQQKNFLFPACAPKDVNHKEFYNECQAPRFHMVATEYGHMDMLDDKIPTLVAKLASCACKNGKEKEPMRKFVGGIMVAFLEAYLKDERGDLEAIIADPSIAPVELNPVEYDEK